MNINKDGSFTIYSAAYLHKVNEFVEKSELCTYYSELGRQLLAENSRTDILEFLQRMCGLIYFDANITFAQSIESMEDAKEKLNEILSKHTAMPNTP